MCPRIPSVLTLLAAASLLAAFGGQAAARDEDADERRISGPVAADVVKVRDGDTVEVEAHIWPQQVVRVAVRLRGIDAPEMRAKCQAEKDAALLARDRLAELLATGSVTLQAVSGDKYFGRVLADVSAKGEEDVAGRLLGEGLVARYDGKARRDWCDGGLFGALGLGGGGKG